MRIAIAVVALTGSVAAAEHKPLAIWQDRVIDDQVSTLTSVSHVLYLDDCRPNGCTVSPGFDDSLTNHSSIASSTVVLDAYKWGDDHWNQLVACAQDTFKPFDIQITTTNPGNAPHFTVMIGGTSRELNPQLDAGGVAPFIGCGATQNNTISFVFATQTSDINFLCGAIAQEASHVWGLDHELLSPDPMTYLDLGTSKRFQNNDADCGESTPRRCRCNGNTQNSFRYLNTQFGLNPALAQPTLTIGTPTDGQWVRPKFPISATFTSDLATLTGDATVDGMPAGTATNGILAWNAPDGLATGPHTIAVSASDAGDRTQMQTVTVNVAGACVSGHDCPSDFSCLTGVCMPGATVAGGLGATCATNAECVSGLCDSDGTQALCTGACNADGSCPSGFDCLDGQNVCWPSGGGGGGCASGGNAGWVLAGLGLAVVLVRRRRN
jgi:hypothetical protein